MDREQEVTIQREVILILRYMAEILTLFIGILKKKVHSLLRFDVVEADKPISEELKQENRKGWCDNI